MRISAVLCVGLCLSATAAPPSQVLVVNTGAYTAVFDPARGGLLRSLRKTNAPRDIVQNMQIYTDFGLYPGGRGYVGTRETVPGKLERRTRNGVTVVRAEGVLAGKPATGQAPTRYRIEYECRPNGSLHIRAGVRPGLAKATDASAFLALQWDVPGLIEFTVRTAKGLIRRRYLNEADRERRAYQGRDLPLDPLRPDMTFLTDTGAGLRIAHLAWSGVPLLTGPVVHGHAVFLCWLDGPGRSVRAGEWAWVEFDLVIGQSAGPGRNK
ncbi:MAG: hypothetical protein GXP31_11525 [Kiritimatiellaeota bacterium]|nr:hypothetical protein [Kiritimatiellota bacterium]